MAVNYAASAAPFLDDVRILPHIVDIIPVSLLILD